MTADPMVTPAWLAARLSDPAVQVVDASWFMPGTPRDAKAEYLAGHVPGAAFFPIDEICDRGSDLPHMLASPEDFAAALRALGVRRGSTIVAYDSQGLFSAPRLWWNLRVMGCDAAVVLDGGLPAWTAEGRPLEAGWPTKPAGDFEAVLRPELVTSLDDVAAAIASRASQIIDARPAARFAGEAPEPRQGLRSGHMPGALSVPFAGVVEGGRLASADRLREIFARAGADLAAPIMTTCGSGISAAVLALALARLGRLDVAVYDGSWTEWGGRPDTPVATGAAAPP
jgi:thiosulfate/3-mercaptopyruvate sulfurtransferase